MLKKIMRKLNEFLLEIINDLTPDNDKLAHFYWGSNYSNFAIVTMVAPCTWLFGANEIYALIPFAFTALLAWAKELRDEMEYGNKSIADFLWTILPAIPLSVLCGIIMSYMS